MKKFTYFFSALLFFASCSAPIKIDSFESEKWISDPSGCKAHRMDLIRSLEAQKDKLIDAKEAEIVKLLGKPDEKELYNRGQWFYTYYLDNGPKCENGNPNRQEAKRISLRFSALGKVSEIIIRT
jgi:hypothetical protein